MSLHGKDVCPANTDKNLCGGAHGRAEARPRDYPTIGAAFVVVRGKHDRTRASDPP